MKTVTGPTLDRPCVHGWMHSPSAIVRLPFAHL